MNPLLLFVLAIVTAPMASLQAGLVASKKVEAPRLVHVVMINLSGSSREARVRDQVVPLPVSERVALQVPAGVAVQITSDSDGRVARAIVLSTSDEGHVFAID
jgi:hypothetical protein